MSRLTCWSCRFSAGHIGGALRCTRHERLRVPPLSEFLA